MIVSDIRTGPALAAAAVFLLLFPFSGSAMTGAEPLRALLVTGGAWHDFEAQKGVLVEGISQRADVIWEVVHEDGEDPQASDHKFSIFLDEGWQQGFDIVVYSHCAGWVTDEEYIESITRVHAEEGIPAVVLHCAMHSYRRAETDAWREFSGVISNRHGPHRPFEVINLKPGHPIMAGFPQRWQTPRGELYHIERIYPGVEPLAHALDVDSGRYEVTVWTNHYRGTRVFGTTIGHHTETMSEEIYLDMVTNGLLWAAGRLGEERQ